jgi:hypothetical protein
VHAVVVRVTINDVDRGVAMLSEEVVPRASQAPGFVAGYWTKSDDNKGLSMLVVESEEQARALAQMIESGGPPSDAVTLEGVEVREVVAHA